MTWEQRIEHDMIDETSAEARLAEIRVMLGCREGHEPEAVRALVELVPPQVPKYFGSDYRERTDL